MPIPCVDVVLRHEEKVFLCKRVNKPAQGLWWLPGGRVMKGELLQDAARRKVKEETGFEITDLELLGTEETIFPDGPFGMPTHTINVIFRATVSTSQVTSVTDGQHDKMQWFTKLPEDLHPYIKKYVEKALQSDT